MECERCGLPVVRGFSRVETCAREAVGEPILESSELLEDLFFG